MVRTLFNIIGLLGSTWFSYLPSKLKTLVFEDPITSSGGLDVYEKPLQGHEYLMTVDVSRGMKLDYSAFILVDITSYPHRLVAKYIEVILSNLCCFLISLLKPVRNITRHGYYVR